MVKLQINIHEEKEKILFSWNFFFFFFLLLGSWFNADMLCGGITISIWYKLLSLYMYICRPCSDVVITFAINFILNYELHFQLMRPGVDRIMGLIIIPPLNTNYSSN